MHEVPAGRRVGPLLLAEAGLVVAGFVLVRLPALGGGVGGRALLFVALLPFLAAVFVRLFLAPVFSRDGIAAIRTVRASVRERGTALFAALAACYLLVLIGSFWRGAATGRLSVAMAAFSSILWLTLMAFGVGAFLGRREGERITAPFLILLGLITFVAANIALRVLGVEAPESITLVSMVREPSTLAAAFGVALERSGFPLGNGLNGFGVMSGATILGSAIVLVSAGSSLFERCVAFAGLIVGVAGLAVVDSRMSLAGVLLLTPLIMLWPVHRLRVLRWFAPISLVLPFLAVGLSLSLAARDVSWLPVRSDADLFTLNNRTIIWGTVALELQAPVATHLVGYGYEGPQASGVIYRAGDFVGQVFDMEHVSVHNAPLQHVLDMGYIGLALLVGFFWFSLDKASNTGRPVRDRRFLVGLLMFVILAGVTESVPSASSSDVLMLTLWLALASAAPLANRATRTTPE
jgi:hypothetical protein